VLVEDTLVHQKAARRVGMQTVWMQRWLHRAAAGMAHGATHHVVPALRLHRRPAYVDRRVRRLRDLLQGYGPLA
jgi:putative hydrolase of the HAD superfamily